MRDMIPRQSEIDRIQRTIVLICLSKLLFSEVKNVILVLIQVNLSPDIDDFFPSLTHFIR